MVAVEGRIQTGKYEKDGRTVYTTDVVADDVRFLDTRSQRSMGGDDERRQGSEGVQATQESAAVASSPGQDPFSEEGKPVTISDDDLPF
ncbi:single-stranded DNA-binding protein [Pasteuria penetrans]|uniref:single-stranded DNA-binding protein n=1 Tax=Pasteuria penetrans TaxID=86005 RepID=UPI000FB43355